MQVRNDTVDPTNGEEIAPSDTMASAGQGAPESSSPPKKAKKKVKKAKKPAAAKKPVGKPIRRLPATAKKAVKPKTKKAATKSKTVLKKKDKRGHSPAGITNKLYKMLVGKLPKSMLTEDNQIDFKRLIAALKMTPEGVYRWFRKDKIMPDKAMLLCKICKGKLKIIELHPFVFK